MAKSKEPTNQRLRVAAGAEPRNVHRYAVNHYVCSSAAETKITHADTAAGGFGGAARDPAEAAVAYRSSEISSTMQSGN